MAPSFDWKTPFSNLQELFPEVDVRILKAVVLEHKDDLNAAAEFILAECLQFKNQPVINEHETSLPHSRDRQDRSSGTTAESSETICAESLHEPLADGQERADVDAAEGAKDEGFGCNGEQGSATGVEVASAVEQRDDSATVTHDAVEDSDHVVFGSNHTDPVDVRATEGEDVGSEAIPQGQLNKDISNRDVSDSMHHEAVDVKVPEGDVLDVIGGETREVNSVPNTGVDVRTLERVVAETELAEADLKNKYVEMQTLFETAKALEAKVDKDKSRAARGDEQSMLQVAELQEAQRMTKDANELFACELMAERVQLKRENDVLQLRLKKVAAEKSSLLEALAEVTANLQARISELEQEERTVQEEIRRKWEAAERQLAVEKANLDKALKYRDELEGQKKACDEAKALLESSGRRVDKCQADIQGLAEKVEQLKYQVDNFLLIESSMLTSHSGYVKFMGLLPGERGAASGMGGSPPLPPLPEVVGGSQPAEQNHEVAATSAGFQLGISSSQMYSSSLAGSDYDIPVSPGTLSALGNLAQSSLDSTSAAEDALPAINLPPLWQKETGFNNEEQVEAMDLESKAFEANMRLFPGESVLAERPILHFLQKKLPPPQTDPEWEMLDHPSGPSSESSTSTNSSLGH